MIHAPAFFLGQRFGVHLRTAVGSVIYRKALRLSHASLAKTTTGQIVNLVTNDVQRLGTAILCWREIGLSVLPGIFLLLLLGPLQGWIGRFFAKLRSKTAVLTDERIKVMNEIISGMRVIKMYTWEKPFAKLVADIRSHSRCWSSRVDSFNDFILPVHFLDADWSLDPLSSRNFMSNTSKTKLMMLTAYFSHQPL
ncbi:hypothetical protein OS493_012436 [Desmophyllum pertusum]|uniref:ABC transmembrane type-1 domain-containing protein n=1 Tax=Desmophyllum pertusum TaxID=174260 RepID=A0A9W9ZRE9_9CNID|nr:hypothetical protein OS493_012436 [Desmophyllum pertusum]